MYTGKYQIKPERFEEFAKAAIDLRYFILEQPGCIDYFIAKSPYDYCTIVSFDKWETAEQAAAYAATDRCKQFGKLRDECMVPGTFVLQTIKAEQENEVKK